MQNNIIASKITRFGYIIDKKTISDSKLQEIKRELTVTPYKPGNYSKFNKKDTSFPVYVENGDYINVPKYYGIDKIGKPLINKLETYKFPIYDMKYNGTLRPNQQIIVDKVCHGFDNQRGGLLIAGCGSGKTNMAIYVACKYNLKTLFVVHKTFLKNQVINRIKSTTNIADVGVIQQKKIKTDSAFVVGMVQSLAKINYDNEIFRDFGLIIIDEVHHMGARNFSRLYQKMSGKYMLGISAESKRTDGAYKLINWYMGPILHVEQQKPNDMVVVKKYKYATSNMERSRVIINKYTEEPDRSTMITNLVHIKRRNRFILNLIAKLFDEGKNILCLTGRLKQVELFNQLLGRDQYMANHVGKYIGGMPERELAVSATKQIILGTYGMAEEGLDIENLNVVILCTPKSAIKQSVGRILRRDVYEQHPIVIDIVDCDNSVFNRQSQSRDKYYRQQNYNIQKFMVSDYKKKSYDDWNNMEFIASSLTQIPTTKKNNSHKKNAYIPNVVKLNIDDIDFID